MNIVQHTHDKQIETQETIRTTINLRNTEIVNNEIYISEAQDGNISQITLNQQKIINNTANMLYV